VRYAILVCWRNGDREYVKRGAGGTEELAVFPSKRRADECADGLRMGFDEGEAQVNVVKWNPRPVLAPSACRPEPPLPAKVRR